ncbi:hypothetical protein, partial [Streptomyces sp. NPDC002491]
MLARRLTRSAHPAVQLRRLFVAAASAGTGFLLLSTLGHALTHPEASASAALRLAWCAAPLAATVYFARAVARTDPGTRPRPGLAAIGLGPTRLMIVSATTTALSTLLGSMLALLLFLHLRGDLTGMPFDGAASDFLAASRPLPLPAALTLLSLVPAASSVAVALMLRPRDAHVAAHATPRLLGRFTAPGAKGRGERFGAVGRYGANRTTSSRAPGASRDEEPRAGARTADSQDARVLTDDAARTTDGLDAPSAHEHSHSRADESRADEGRARRTPGDRAGPDDRTATGAGADDAQDALRRTVPSAVGRSARTVTERLGRPGGPDTRPANGTGAGPAEDPSDRPENGRPEHARPTNGRPADGDHTEEGDHTQDAADPGLRLPQNPPAPDPTALPWGAALLAAGLAVEGYASRTADGGGLPLPGGL